MITLWHRQWPHRREAAQSDRGATYIPSPTMNKTPLRFFLALSLALLAVGCTAGLRSPSPAGPGDAGGPAGAHILTEEQLAGVATTNLLDAIRSRINAVEVRRDGGGCPRIAIRGRRAIQEGASPIVYINGTRMVDTCSIDQLRLHEVRQVEVYPAGSSGRPGYANSPHGLIIIFLKNE
jgi:hypothetical protein